MGLGHGNHRVQQFAAAAAHPTPFCQGQPTAVRTVVMFIERIAPGTSVPYLASWSRMRNFVAGS